jgi:hypothetical protein
MNIRSTAGAMFSPCREFRYHLHRIWDHSRPTALFIMLNPSTADEFKLDPTVTRCMKFAERWNAGGFEVLNLFAYRATDPRNLKVAGYPVGPMNDEVISERVFAHRDRRVIVAWGANVRGLERPTNVLRIIRDEGATPFALALTADGIPRHPLYLRADAMPKIFSPGG